MAVSQDFLNQLNSVSLEGDVPTQEPEEPIRDINDLKLQLTSSIAQSMAETSFSEEDVEPDSFMETADTIAGIPQKMLEAGIEVPTTLATGLGGMIVGGVETVGRGVLGAIDSDFYPQEDGYEGFQDWI